LKRGRPILISVRVPDSVGYARDMGLDVETWLADGLVDILVTTGYFRLEPWRTSVDLGHKYGVAVYPCLSDSRATGQTRFFRGSLESYRGRAVNAWLAGADGVHLFNYFHARSPLWKEIGSPETLVGLDKLYFVTVRDGNPNAYLKNGLHYRRTAVLTPSYPLLLKPDTPAVAPMTIGEDFVSAEARGLTPVATLHIRMLGNVPVERLETTFNGRKLSNGARQGEWIDYALKTDWIRRGENTIGVALRRARRTERITTGVFASVRAG